MIKNLVISGGGIWGFSCYGALRESNIQGFWNINNIERIYSTSVGSMISIMLLLKYEWNDIDDFLIKRPWNDVFTFNFNSLITSFEKRGIFCKDSIYTMYLPLFQGKNISTDITLEELYEKTNIEIHLYSTEINGNKLKKIDFSHLTYPKWKVLEALYCSCCLPILFSPMIIEDKCYIDGGIVNNYPIMDCLNTIGFDKETEIFGIRKISQEEKKNITTEFSIFDYILLLINKIIINSNETPSVDIKNQLSIHANITNIYDIYMASTSSNERKKLIEYGKVSFLDWQNRS